MISKQKFIGMDDKNFFFKFISINSTFYIWLVIKVIVIFHSFESFKWFVCRWCGLARLINYDFRGYLEGTNSYFSTLNYWSTDNKSLLFTVRYHYFIALILLHAFSWGCFFCWNIIYRFYLWKVFSVTAYFRRNSATIIVSRKQYV